jgi:hypothetical protein
VRDRDLVQSSTCAYAVFSALFVKETIFFSNYVFGILVKKQMAVCVGFISGSSILFLWFMCLFDFFLMTLIALILFSSYLQL